MSEDEMSKKQTFAKELKGLGKDLSKAFKIMLSSEEFKHLEKEIATGAKAISKSLQKSLSAARKSPSTKKLKTRLKRVVKAGKKEGTEKARKAQTTATKGLRKARHAIRNLQKKK
ncbi:hypothetical protein BVX98_01880 [bacterium F11]|nr:hypothetical protein BVX98_01880 [bacterium F11]